MTDNNDINERIDDRPRYRVVETYAHELEHVRMQNETADYDRQHEIIADRNTIDLPGMQLQGVFWNWPRATWSILPHL